MSVERLNSYYQFDSSVLEAVGQAAEFQNAHSYQQLVEHYQVPEVPKVLPTAKGDKAAQILTLTPADDYDTHFARVLHAPMAKPLEQSLTMRALRLFAADPSQQLIVVGNPGSIGRPHGKLPLGDVLKVWRGDLAPTVEPLLRYLAQQGIESVDHIGYSYGADKGAAAASVMSEDFDMRTATGIFIEPAAVEDRGLLGLRKDFTSCGESWRDAVSATESSPLIEAHQLADSGMARYIGGMLRLSNLAIANSLAYRDFEQRVDAALISNADMQVAIAWGSDSELVPYLNIKGTILRLRREFGLDRTASMELKGMNHGGGDDIDLHAAIILQSYSRLKQLRQI